MTKIINKQNNEPLTHAKQTVWQTSKLLQKRSLRGDNYFRFAKVQ